MKEDTLRGTWWIPGQEVQITGRLSLSESERPRLDLEGLLGDPFTAGAPEIIQGIASTGKRVSLLWCQPAGATLNVGGAGIHTCAYSASIAVLGYHFDSLNQVRFRRLGVLFDYVSHWARRSGIQYEFAKHPGGLDGHTSFRLHYQSPELPTVVLDDKTTVRLNAIASHNIARIGYYRLQEKLFFEVEPPQPQRLDDHLGDYIRPLQHFISFGIGQPVYPVEIYGIIDDLPDGETNHDLHSAVEIYYPARRKPREEKRMLQPYMLFSLADLGDDYPSCLQHWYRNIDALRPVYNLYFSVLFASEMYLEGRFLNLIQALEVLHRRLWGGTYLPEASYSPLRDRFASVIREQVELGEVADAMIGRLDYWNEWTLRRRIKDAAARCGEWLDMLIPDRASFAARVTNTRNYLTHFDARLEDAAARGKDLYLLAERVRFLLEAVLLSLLGLPDDRVGKIIAETQHYLWIQSVLEGRSKEFLAT
jgi:hypothetical protein